MARSKTTTKRKKIVSLDVAGRDESGERMTEVIPTPPPSEDEEKLSVDIPTRISWRLKIALLTMESKGKKTAKKKFVVQAITEALDKLDAEWGDANA